MELSAGTRLGPYEILAPLGAGGMGEVYRARDPRLKRDVALKVLPDEVAQDPARLARFQREAELLASLNHPHIAAIHGLEEAAGKPLLVLELVEGKDLSERLKLGRIPLEEAVAIGTQIAEALEEAHGKGIIHRDLKLANVKLTPEGKVKVLDFGLAKTFAQTTSDADSALPTLEQPTREGVVMGTAGYMSPEQARGQVVDERADIWSFGCVLWELLTGSKAFGGATLSDSIGATLHVEPDWERLPVSTPPRLKRLAQRCLAKDPRERLHHIADVRIELEDSDPPPTVVEKAPRGHRVAMAVLALLVGALVVAVALLRPTSDRLDSPGDNPLAGARFTRVTNFEGSELGAAISPDGRFVAFVSDRDGSFDTLVGQIDVGEFRNVTQALSDVGRGYIGGPVRHVGFTRDGSEIWLKTNDRIQRTPLLGGPMRSFLGAEVQSVEWSPDGESLVFFELPDDPIYVADRDGTNSRLTLGSAGGGVHQHFPVWSVDGRWIYLVRGTPTTMEMNLWRVRPDGGELEQLTRGQLDVRFPTPLDERTVLYSARDGDGAGPWLWWMDVETKIAQRASVGLEQYTSVAGSADGRRLVATVQDPQAGLWSVPILDRPATESDASPFGDLPTARALGPRFGGASLFYLSSRGSGDGLWRYDDGQIAEIWRGSETALLEPAAVSPDGQSVVLLLRRDDGWRLHVLSADGAELRVLSEALEARGAAAWSPDRRWVVAGGSVAGVSGLFKIPVDGGAPERIADGEAMDPVWSPDGSLIVYAGSQKAGPFVPLLAVRPDGQPVDLPEIRMRHSGEGMRFLPDSSGLVYLQGRLRANDFWLLDLGAMTTRQLTTGDLGVSTRSFDITPDGRRIVFDRLSQDSDIVLIELGGESGSSGAAHETE